MGADRHVRRPYMPEARLLLRAQAAEQLMEAADPAEAGRKLFELIATELKLDAFLLYVRADDGRFDLIAHGGLSDAQGAMAAALGLTIQSDKQLPLTGHIVKGRTPADEWTSLLGGIGLNAWFGHPLTHDDQLLGIFGFGRRSPIPFDDDDLSFLTSIARFFALALNRVRGEAALRESEERLEMGMALAGFGTFDINMVTGQAVLSPQLCAIIGMKFDPPTPVEMLPNVVHPEDREQADARHQACYDPAGPGQFSMEHRIIRPDGTVRWVHVQAKAFFAGQGEARRAVRMIGALRDITERKLAEQRLQESEQRLRLAVEAAGFGIFEYDVEHDEVIWSPELWAMYGMDPEEGTDLEKVLSRIHPDDWERNLAPIHAVAQSDRSEDWSYEYRIFRPDGEMRWLAATTRQLFSSGQPGERPTRIVGVIQDVTESKLAEQRLRQSEQRLQRAQEMGDVASFDWDPESDDFWVSESYRRIIGLPQDANPTRRDWKQLVHPDDWERSLEHVREVETSGETQKFEQRIIRPIDQQVRWVWVAFGAARDSPHSPKRIAGISLDITERKRNEERERLLSREVDHRAKNLLNVVQAMVQLTQADSIPEFVDQIKGRIQSLARVHGLLAASRWDGAELTKLIKDELAPFAGEQDRIRVAGPPVALRPAAAQSIALLIHELTTNAAKFGALSVPGGRIDVMWECGDAVPGQLVLHWREQGGPPVREPQHGGFGMNIMRHGVPFQLGATSELQWHTEGLEYKIVLPSRQLVQG